VRVHKFVADVEDANDFVNGGAVMRRKTWGRAVTEKWFWCSYDTELCSDRYLCHVSSLYYQSFV